MLNNISAELFNTRYKMKINEDIDIIYNYRYFQRSLSHSDMWFSRKYSNAAYFDKDSFIANNPIFNEKYIVPGVVVFEEITDEILENDEQEYNNFKKKYNHCRYGWNADEELLSGKDIVQRIMNIPKES